MARSVLVPLYQRVADRIATRLEPQIARSEATLDAFDSTLESIRTTLESIKTTLESIGPTLESKVATVHADLEGHLRSETEELARMLRLQGDADDELAATLGRTLARLSAEVETLSASVGPVEPASRPAAP